MGKNNNLNDFLTDIADAIRTKKGTEDPINAQNFASEISTISGVPDVPTLECWKITLPLDDMDPLYWLLSDIHDFSDHFIVVSEFDGNIYGGFGPMFGSGSADYSANIFYVGILINGGNHFRYNCLEWTREYLLDPYGEQISLSEFLSTFSRANNFDY